MSDAPARKAYPQAQSSASGHTQMTSRQPYISEPIASKRVCFYKSGDAQFSGLPVIINSRTFKTFEGLLDSLSKRVPLPFGVRTITTPRGHTTVRSLDQLHHGHSYICSDRRTVKPIDLEQARRKLPPWYHARPVSARRSAWQMHSSAPRGTRSAKRNEHAALLHTPKRLVVFRNGEPEVKHTLMLQKRTTHSFEALLGHMSEVMNFPVLKLYTPDGKRVDGLPALILCSGVLVAAGREPFKKRSYDVQKPSPPTWLPAKKVGRLRPRARKKKYRSFKTRPFSPSSERYFVDQIHNSIGGSMCDCPSNPTGSVEVESGQPLESLAGTDTIICLDAEVESETHIPPDDDIEKSFRVNQDGSMTVEMKVRLTIKEEETIHWTTTVSRSSVASQIKETTDSCPDLDACFADNMLPHNDPISIKVSETDPGDSNLSYPEVCKTHEQSEINGGTLSLKNEKPMSPLTHSPEWHKVQEQQASIESVRTVTDTEIQENRVGSYSYKEDLSNGEIKEEYCIVQHCSRPVPKPRSTVRSEINNTTTTRLQSSSYRASEILKLEENGKEVRETVLHIYGQQTCQENFSGSTQLCLQGFGNSPYGSPRGHSASSDTVFPASSDKTFRSSTEDIQSETLATTKCQSIRVHKKLSSTSKSYTSTYKASTTSTQRSKKSILQSPHVTRSQKASVFRGNSTPAAASKRKPVRIIVKKNHLFKTATKERKQKDDKFDILKEIKKIRSDILSQTGAIRLKEHFRAKALQKQLKRRNNSGNGSVPLKPQTEQLESSIPPKTENPSLLLGKKELTNIKETPTQATSCSVQVTDSYTLPKKNLLHASLSKGTLMRQTSMHEERGSQTLEISQSMCLPALQSSSSLKNEYVKLWLQNSQSEPHLDEEPSNHTKPQENETLPSVSEQETSTEVSEINCEIVEGEECGEMGTEDSVFNVDLIKSTAVSTDTSSINATSQDPVASEETSHKSHLPRRTLPPSSSNKSLLEEPKLPSSHEMTPLARKLSLKKSSHSLNSTFEKHPSAMVTSLKKTGNVNLKDTPSPTHTIQGTPLPSQPSLENIPKNNTIAKASLFNNESVEKMPISADIIDKAEFLLHSSQIRKLAHSEELQANRLSLQRLHENQTKPPAELMHMQTEKYYTVKMAVRPDMMPVLDQLCHSIQSLREITQRKRPSCLKKNNSMPDFSSHLTSTFGSSSRVLLAFLSIMALKDGLSHLNARCPAESNLSCSEAMLMLQSLKELALIEDAEKLRASLTDLHASASVQLLQRWRGFQELSNKAGSRGATPDTTGSESHFGSCSEEEEQAIQGLMGDLGVPERVREELAALSSVHEYMIDNQVEESYKVSDSVLEVKVNGFSGLLSTEEMGSLSDDVLEDYVNIYVNSVIDRAVNAHLKESNTSHVFMADSLARPGKDIVVMADRYQEGKGIDERSKSCLVSCEGNHTSSSDEKLSQEGKDGSYNEEHVSFHKERSFNTEENLDRSSPMPNDGVELTCSNEKIFEHSECQTVNTQNQLHNKINSTERHVGLLGQHSISQVITKRNVEDYKIQHSKAHQDLCFESKTFKESEEEHVIIEPPECYTIYQENFMKLSEATEYEKNETNFNEERTNSVAKLISSLQAQERSMDKRPYKTVQRSSKRLLNHSNIPNIQHSDDSTYVTHVSNERKKIKVSMKGPSEQQVYGDMNEEELLYSLPDQQDSVEAPKTRTTESILTAPLSSSLAFSYDSRNSVLPRDPEGNIQINRVKSIREMFLAKSNTDMRVGQTRLGSPNSDMSDYQPESSDSREHLLSSSPEVSRGEEDTSRLAIAKGYVKRTIERLYGKASKGSGCDETRPSSASKTKKREGLRGTNVSSLASFHEARSNVISDLSYFNATSSVDGLNEPAHCISLNSQMGPRDAVLIDKGRWLLRESQVSMKASPDPADTPVNVNERVIFAESEQDSGKEDVPYSLFGPMSPDKAPSFTEQAESPGMTFTYFNLPNASDSELEPDDRKADSPKKTAETVTSEKHGILTAFTPPDIKKTTNKVHPLIETESPVVTQPTKGQSAQTGVARRSAEPDAVEMLYVFCGQHCPIL